MSAEPVVDLMTALERSLEQAKEARRRAEAERKAQGLPPQVKDKGALAKAVALVKA